MIRQLSDGIDDEAPSDKHRVCEDCAAISTLPCFDCYQAGYESPEGAVPPEDDAEDDEDDEDDEGGEGGDADGDGPTVMADGGRVRDPDVERAAADKVATMEGGDHRENTVENVEVGDIVRIPDCGVYEVLEIHDGGHLSPARYVLQNQWDGIDHARTLIIHDLRRGFDVGATIEGNVGAYGDGAYGDGTYGKVKGGAD